MKIRLWNNQEQTANTLAVTLVTTGIIGLLLVAYLGLVQSQNISNMRSQCWNQAIPVIEAGIEDALTHLNTHGLTNLSCDNWNHLGDIYYMKRAVGDGYYVVTISNWFAGYVSNTPVIESRGFVTAPTVVAANDGPMIAGIPSLSSHFLGRGVRAAAKRDWLFSKGMVAKGQIDLKGNTITTDSFDSSDPAYNTNGYYCKALHKANGDVATNSQMTNSLGIGNADIWGHIATGPKGTPDVGQGSVGDEAWHLARRKGIEPGYYKNDMNVDFPDVEVPWDGGYLTPSSGTNDDGVACAYLLNRNENYQLNGDLTMSGSDMLYVASNTTVSLYITGNVDMSGTASIRIAPGGTLRMYVAGASANLGGNGVINDAGNATNFAYYGMPSNTSLNLGGNAAFTGVIYAPSAAFTGNGGGAANYDFVGASITASVDFNGRFNFHYDEALAKIGPFRRYIVTRWDEMTPDEVARGVIDHTPRDVIQ